MQPMQKSQKAGMKVHIEMQKQAQMMSLTGVLLKMKMKR